MKVICIVLDCARYDHFGCNGNESIYTPTIDELARKGCTFHNHFSAAPWTSPSVASLLSGIYPHKLGMFRNHQSFPDNTRSIFQYYNSAGKSFGSFVKSNNFFGQDDQAGVAGFSWDLPGMLRWIEQHNDQDYFLYLHYWNTHLPYFTRYSKNAWYDGMLKLVEMIKTGDAKNIEKAKNLYRASIERASEEFIYSIIEKLDNLKSLDDSLIVITGDHGESWGQRLQGQEPLDLFGMHGKSLYDEVLHIPLIIFGKDIPPGKDISNLTRSVDIFPTLLEMNGWDIDNSGQYLPIDGKSLQPVMSGTEEKCRICFASTAYLDEMQENVITEVIEKHACRDNKWKFIHDKQKNTYELYDIINDPGETCDVKEKQSAIFQKFKDILQGYIDQGQSADNLDINILASKLKNLGYM